ncbi:MAG: hypothetical protein U0168_22275 [Nannocystaceae bacterium]
MRSWALVVAMQGGAAAPDAPAREPAPAAPPSATPSDPQAGAPAPAPGDGELVTWTAPPGCPDDAAMERRIAELVASSTAKDGIARADVRREGDAYVVDVIVAIDGTEHPRTLRAPDCESLADAAALVVALTLDPTALDAQPQARTDTASTATTVAPETTTTRTRETTSAAEDATPATRRSRGRTPTEIPAAAAGARVGDRRSAVERLGLGSRAAGQRAAGRCAGGDVASRRARGRGAGVVAAAARARTERRDAGVARLRHRRRVPASADAAGRVRPVPGHRARGHRARGIAARAASVTTVPWAAPLGRVALRVPLRRGLGLVAGVELAVPLNRLAVDAGSAGELFVVQPVSARLLLGLDGRARP